MRFDSRYLRASALLLMSLAGCGNGGASVDDNRLPEYLRDTWGIWMTGFLDDGELKPAADGSLELMGTGKITVDGLGTADITTLTRVAPLAMGGTTTLAVADPVDRKARLFHYDPTQNYLAIYAADPNTLQPKGVAVSKHPDGGYRVWAFEDLSMVQTVRAPDGYEALRLVEKYNEFKALSPYVLLTAFAIAHSPTPEARASIPCRDTALTPPVCDLFKEFCECAACLVLNRQGACGQCPKL